jgi:hypothetical protein
MDKKSYAEKEGKFIQEAGDNKKPRGKNLPPGQTDFSNRAITLLEKQYING